MTYMVFQTRTINNYLYLYDYLFTSLVIDPKPGADIKQTHSIITIDSCDLLFKHLFIKYNCVWKIGNNKQ